MTKSFTIICDERGIITVKAEFYATVNESAIPQLVDMKTTGEAENG